MLDTSVLVGRIPEEVLERIEEYSSSMIVRAELGRGLTRFRSMKGGERRARVRAQRGFSRFPALELITITP